MGTIVMFVVMFGTLLIGVPIGASLALSLLSLVILNPVTTQEFIAQSMYSGLDSFTLLALPFFMLAGSVMETGGISKKLVNFANSLVGNITGSLGVVTIIACMFFGAISGSASATVAAIGTIMIPQMIKAGYDKYYATGLVAVAGGLGVIVPPSYPLVIYGVTNNVSIGDLFIAGIGPAILVGLVLMMFNYVMSKKRGYKGTGARFNIKVSLKTLWDAKFAMLMPVIILGGIYGGIFTATEAAVVSVVYGIIIGLFVYKELNFKDLWKMYKSNMVFVGGMMFTFAPAAAMGSIFAYLGIPKAINNFFFGISTNSYVILFLIFILMLIVGMFVQTTPAIVILSPILLSVVSTVGINPIHFGLVMTLGLAIAFVTPPVAVNLFVASSMTGLGMEKIVKSALPFIIGLFIALVIVGYVPQISLGIFSLLGRPML